MEQLIVFYVNQFLLLQLIGGKEVMLKTDQTLGVHWKETQVMKSVK